MKKIILILISIIFSFNYLNAQDSISETEKLVSLAKIHGFLKYYHPEVGKGKYDWDKEFIKLLPKVLNSSDKQSLSEIYMDWIGNFGIIEICKKCDSIENSFDKNFDLSWTRDSTNFTNELISKLKFIEENRIQDENFYVTTSSAGQVKITNEPSYENFEYPDEAYRLLGLFKYWNIVEYFYPYKYLADHNWDSVLKEMIPKFRTVKNKEQYQFAIKELIAKLDDSHVWVNFADKKDWKYLPIKVSKIENKPVISGFYNDSLAELNNLRLGDIILKINGKDFKLEIEKELKFVSGSNKNHKTLLTYNKVLTGIDNEITLTIQRNSKVEQIKVKRYKFNDFNYWENKRKIKSKSLNEKTGYINMASDFKRKEIDNVFGSFKDKKTIIIDLRNYPYLKYKLFSKYLNSEKRIFTKIYKPNIDYPGKFKIIDLHTTYSKKAFKGKIILLVNEESLSRSEFTAMVFQTGDNVITVGNQTAGADGDLAIFEFLGGFRTTFSGNGILYPDGSETQRKGIKIDVEVKPTINGLRQGRDEVLEKAIELVSEKK